MGVPTTLSSHLPGSQALLEGVSFPLAALARRSSPVASSPAHPWPWVGLVVTTVATLDPGFPLVTPVFPYVTQG